MLFIAVATQAQNATVTKVRQLYADAKQEIAKREQNAKEGQNPNDLVVTSNYYAQGSGPAHDETHYYHSSSYNERLMTVFYRPFFITRKYNVGAQEFYQEFLFDDQNEGKLVFYFQKNPDGETRYYYGENGLAHEIVKGERAFDEATVQRLATDLCEAFDKLMNREY